MPQILVPELLVSWSAPFEAALNGLKRIKKKELFSEKREKISKDESNWNHVICHKNF